MCSMPETSHLSCIFTLFPLDASPKAVNWHESTPPVQQQQLQPLPPLDLPPQANLLKEIESKAKLVEKLLSPLLHLRVSSFFNLAFYFDFCILAFKHFI